MFNPQARWDSPGLKPKRENHKIIEVVARFSAKQIKPLYFTLGGQRYDIERINYFWKDHLGTERIYCFSVTSSGTIFQIYFNNQSLSWRLAKIE